MKRPSIHLHTFAACLLTIAVAAAAAAAQAGQGTVTGTVVDAITRKPIAGASVTISPGGLPVATNASGVYQATVPVGTVSLTVSAANRPLQSVFGIVIGNGATTTVNFSLSAPTIIAGTGILTGYVRIAATNPPIGIANATVSVSPGGNSTATDANGRYELSLPAGTYTVSVSALFYAAVSTPGALVLSQKVTTRDLQLSSVPGVLDVLHRFAGGADGFFPGSLIKAADGDLYGTAAGGSLGGGVIFKMTPDGTLTVLHAFAEDVDGQPDGLIQGADGDFYGTTCCSGPTNSSTAFRMTSGGDVSLLHVFAADVEGSPAGLVQSTNGDFYGTSYGGPTGYGTVFRMTPDGQVTVLHAFSDGADGAHPNSGLIQGTDGNFYGTTVGRSDRGSVFKVTPAGIVTVLHKFTGGTDGGYPYVGLIQAADGDFYGTTWGGSLNWGTVFKMTPAGDVTTLHSFSDPEYPNRLLQGRDGNLYGTTFGSPEDFYGGTIFRMTPDGTYATLHTFTAFSTGGANPCGGLVQGTDGHFYGTTCYGGASNRGAAGQGVAFRLRVSPTPTAILFGSVRNGTTNAPVADGSKAPVPQVFQPSRVSTKTVAGPIRDTKPSTRVSPAAGVAVPAATQSGEGIVTGIVTDAVTRAAIAGALVTIKPGGLVVVTNGAGVYQTTVPVGTFSLTVSVPDRPFQSVFGVVVKNGATTTVNLALAKPGAPDLEPSPKRAVFEALHAFAPYTNGDYPVCLVQATDGYFYGTTAFGGSLDFGTVFKMTPDGSRFTVLHRFSGGADGTYPFGLIQAADGDFYILAKTGYPWFGAVFKMTSAGDVTVVHEFRENIADAPNGLIKGTDGDFYGTTLRGGPSQRGTVFKMTPDGIVTLLHAFSPDSEGMYPNADLIQATDGNFYGTTYFGGSSGFGTVFKMTPGGIVTVLREFTGDADGANPDAGLIQALDGNFYGTTSTGTIFKITPAGDFTTLHSFSNAGPPSRLLQAADGNFYGTTFGDDTLVDGGSIFRMTPAGAITTLHSFDYWSGSISTGGAFPWGGLVGGTDGFLYGITLFGGIPNQAGRGTVFRLRFSSTAASPFLHESGTEPRRSGLIPSINRSLFGRPANSRRFDFGTARRPARPSLPVSGAHSAAWEVEGFGGATFASQPPGGTGALPPAGVPFTTTTGSQSRHVSSWYFSDGAQLLNSVSTALGVSQQITPLDAALNTSLVERPSGGGGFRLSRVFTPRLTAEFTIEFSAVRGELSSAASTGIEASRATFQSAWNGLASAGQFVGTTVTSGGTVQIDNGHQIVATGAVNVALKKDGKAIPYLTAGAGISSHSGNSVSASLSGDYKFALGGVTPFHEADSVTVRYTAAGQVAVGVLGAGIKYQVSPHVGLRFDYRTYLGPNRSGTFVDSKPVVSTLSPAGSGASATTPGIQFSNDASIGIPTSLSGPTIADFRTFTGSGVQRHARLTIGLFLRF